MKMILVFTSLLFSTLTLADIIIKPGEVKSLRFQSKVKGVRLFCRQKEIHTLRQNDTYYAIISESYFSKLKPFDCVFKEKKKTLQRFKIQVASKDYPSEKLRVSPDKVKFSLKDQKLRDDEEKTYQKIFANSHPQPLFEQAFQKPVANITTSPFGVKRLFNGDTKSHHFGVDFRAANGSQIAASNSGKVVYSGHLFLSGNVVFIDHGLNIVTVYNHLSKPLVKVGDQVKKGQVIGLSGSTGRITGPHLHWDVYVDGHYVDGMSLIEETKNF